MENVWDVLQKEVTTHIDELISSLSICTTNITAIRALLSSKLQKYDKLDQFDEAMQVMRADKERLQNKIYLKALIANLDNSVSAELTKESDENIEGVNITIINVCDEFCSIYTAM